MAEDDDTDVESEAQTPIDESPALQPYAPQGAGYVTDPALLAQLNAPAQAPQAPAKNQYVTDPSLLAQLNAPASQAPQAPAKGQYVTDPALLAQLNGAAPEAEGVLGTMARKFAHSVLPTLGGAAAGAWSGAAGGSWLGPWGAIGGGLIGGAAGGYAAATVQEAGLKALGYDDSHQQAVNAEANPIASATGEYATLPLAFGRGAMGIAGRAASAAITGGLEAGTEYAHGEPISPARVVTSAAMGAAFPQQRGYLAPIEQRGAALGARLREQYGSPWQPGEAAPVTPSPHGSPGAEAAAGTAEAKPAPTEAGGAPQPTNTNNYGKAEPRPASTEQGTGGVNLGSDPTIEAALRAKMQPEGGAEPAAPARTIAAEQQPGEVLRGPEPAAAAPEQPAGTQGVKPAAEPVDAPVPEHIASNRREALRAFSGTPMEARILKMAREGQTAGEIAKATGLDTETVRTLRDNAGIAPAGPLGGITMPPNMPRGGSEPPAAAAPPEYRVTKDTQTNRHLLFRDDEVIGDFANRGEAMKARNLALIKDTAARRQQAAPAAPETMQRRPIVRDPTGRPIETARMPLGAERAILERGYARATGPRPPPGVEQPPLMQAARRQGPTEPEGAAPARAPPPPERLSISAGKDPETGKPAQLLMRGENVVGAYPSYSEARQALNRMQAAAAPKAGAGTPPRPPGQAAGAGGAGGAGAPPRPPTVGQAAAAGAGRTPPPGAPPSLPQNRSTLSNLWRSMKLLVGADIGPHGREAEHVIRGAYGDAQRAFEQTINLLNPHQETVRPMSEIDRRAMMNRIEGGNRFPNWQPTPEQQSLIDVHKKAMDVWKDQLGKLDRTAQMKFVDDYAAHMYQNPAQAREFFSQYGKRGGAGSTKARTHATYEDAIDAGLKPLTDNPVEIATRYGLSMKNFIASNDALERGVKTGVVGYFTSGKNVGATGSPEPQQVGGPPPGWKKLDAPPKGPFLEAYAPEDFADKYNTFYSKGLRDRHAPIYDAFRNANGAWTQLELGLNAYHFFTMANEAIISDAAKGLSQMMSGQLGKGALAIARAPLAPVIRAIEGKRFQQEYLNPNSTNPIASIMAEANARPIGRGHAYDILGSAGDENISRGSFVKNFSANKINSEFKQAWNDIKQDWGLADTVGKQALFPFKQASRALQTVGAPLFDKYIPALKAGALHSQMEAWLEANPHVDISTPDGRRAAVDAAKKISDSVDNRFGEMVHDNLFMNQTLRQSAVVSMRSFSWAMGAMREIAGGTYAAGKAGALSLKTGENRFSMAHPEYDPRISYAIAFPFVVATISSIYQYLRAGEAPQDWRDLYAPRTGGTIPGLGGKGQVQEHALMPGFQKDVYGWLAHPGREAYAKLGGLPTTFIEQLTNQDWRGDPITKHGANPLDQFQQRMAHLFSKLGPIGIRSMVKGQPATSGITPVETALGFRAPGVDIQDPERLENWLKANAGKQWKAKERHEKTEQRKYGRERAYDPREREQQPQ